METNARHTGEIHHDVSEVCVLMMWLRPSVPCERKVSEEVKEKHSRKTS